MIFSIVESSHRSESGSGYWQLQLDRDLIETISAIYPEWFKNNMAEGGPPTTPRESPPKAVVDTSPLLNSLEQNKECKSHDFGRGPACHNIDEQDRRAVAITKLIFDVATLSW